jgi:Domain of unknown function (DUF4091)/Immunoglobulin domain/Immunoglobulin I-set domain
MVVHDRLSVVFVLLLASFGFVGCSGLVSAGNNSNPSPTTLAIASVQAACPTGSSCQIAWTTNVPADSTVAYGSSTSYGFSTPVDSAMVTSHQITLSGLAADTTYYYQVSSTDSKGNNGRSGGHSVKTSTAPSITTQPVSQTVTAGQTASFSVAATGTAPISYQWNRNGTAISGATSSGYTTPATTSSDNGAAFTVVVSNTVGSATSNPAALTVNAATVAPSIKTQPTSQTVTAGQTASFSVAATGTAPLSYQWQRNGVAIGGATLSRYTTPATTSSDNGALFTVAVSNTTGSVTSNAATLTVNAAPVPPSITAQPTSQTVTAGQTASFSVAATGTAPLSFQWQRNGANIAGAISSSYTTPTTTTSDSGSTFLVLVSNTGGTVTSSAATLTVNTAPVAPSITTQPSNQTVTAGQTASFRVAAAGTAPLSYEWQRNGVAIGGATSSTYTTPATTSSDNGAQFTVAVSNTAGSITSSAATLTVSAAPIAPSITSQPTSQTVTAGQTASFSVAATGTAPLSYQWQKNGANIAGATTASYTTPATTTSDSGSTFRVLVSNTAGTATSNAATLTVNAVPVAPSITTQPASQTVTAGQTASFSVAATGTAPITFQWQKNGANIAGATTASYTTPPTTTSDSGSTFRVVVSNSAGTVTSSAATLTVNAVPVAPSITTQPASQTVTAGQTASFSVAATGTAPLSYQWQRNGVAIGGATSSGYTTPATAGSDNGAQFTVAVSNTAGSVTSNAATLTVNSVTPPSFSAWVAPSLNRVGPTDAAGTTSSISLSSARGETVDSQVVVQGPSSGLSNVNLTASALTGPGGATIPASNITLYREYYLSVTGTANYGGGSNPPLGSGTYPEPLIPFNDPETGAPLCASAAALKACNTSITAGQNQPYWIDISVPRGATNSPPGTYTGSISITSAQGNASIPVSLTVWNFELPAQPSELSLWTLWPPAAGNTVTTLAQALMRNKVMGWYDVPANASSDIAKFGLNRSGVDDSYHVQVHCDGSYTAFPSRVQPTRLIKTAAASFPAGLALDLYVADETNDCPSSVPAIKKIGTLAHASNRSIKTMITLNAPDPNLYDEGDGRSAIDRWVLLDSVQRWPALPWTGPGDLWSYTSCNTGSGNTPEWLVDYPPINERIQAGFLNWTQGATGILYYRADGWTNGNTIASWNNVDTTACGGGLGRPGDGIFVYPPGPIASTESAPGIRLKAVRDGIQDYEYAQILKNLGQVGSLNSIVQPIAATWINWSHDPITLERARMQLGQLLNQIAPH